MFFCSLPCSTNHGTPEVLNCWPISSCFQRWFFSSRTKPWSSTAFEMWMFLVRVTVAGTLWHPKNSSPCVSLEAAQSTDKIYKSLFSDWGCLKMAWNLWGIWLLSTKSIPNLQMPYFLTNPLGTVLWYSTDLSFFRPSVSAVHQICDSENIMKEAVWSRTKNSLNRFEPCLSSSSPVGSYSYHARAGCWFSPGQTGWLWSPLWIPV